MSPAEGKRSRLAGIEKPWHIELIRFLKHCVTGVIAVAIHYGVMWFVLQFGGYAVVASSVGFIGGALTRSYLSYFHVFEPTRTIPRAGAKFILALGVQFLLNGGLLWLLLELQLPVWPAQLLTTISVALINYAVHRIWVFS